MTTLQTQGECLENRLENANRIVAAGYFDRAKAIYATGDKNTALQELNEAIKFDPNLAQAYVGRGYINLDRSNYPEAITNFDQALKLLDKLFEEKPTDVWRYLTEYPRTIGLRGFAKRMINDYQGALLDLNQAVLHIPNSPGLHLNRGIAKSKLNMAQDAIEDFDKTLELDPQCALAYHHRALERLILKNSDFNAVLQDYNHLTKLMPLEARFFYERGKIKELLLKDKAAASEDFKEAIRLEPTNSDYREQHTRLSMTSLKNSIRVRLNNNFFRYLPKK